MSETNFIFRNEKGTLCQNLNEWRNFKLSLFSKAKSVQELEFIGQLVEDLQYEYEERLEELEEQE